MSVPCLPIMEQQTKIGRNQVYSSLVLFATCTLATTCCGGHPACIASFPGLPTPPVLFLSLQYAKYCKQPKTGGVDIYTHAVVDRYILMQVSSARNEI